MNNLHMDPLSAQHCLDAHPAPGSVSPMETSGQLTFPTYSGSVPVYSSTTKN